jgi:3-phosphoshikimate 1-carboxyvinyltransferase
MKSVSPGRVEGRIGAPHSKSVFQRAVAAAALAEGKSTIVASRRCADDVASLAFAQALGAKVGRSDEAVEITGPAAPEGGVVNCRESGLCLRMFAAIASLFDKKFTLLAEGSLRRRPVDMVADPLRSLGAECTTADGLPPLTLKGPIHGGTVEVDARVSSQFVTGLLIALPRCEADSEILAPGLRSKPYVELTAWTLEKFGIRIDVDPGLTRFIVPGGQIHRAARIEVGGDWSGAAFMFVAGATAGAVTVTGLNPESPQPDRQILTALDLAGAKVSIGKDAVSVSEGELWAFEFDATDCPDLFPPLVALALRCEGTTEIRGAGRLRQKESDRGAALVKEFAKLGTKIEVDGDVMRITGGAIGGGGVDSHGDHRIAMALAVAALNATDAVDISGDEAVDKSYPGFFDDLMSIGARIK